MQQQSFSIFSSHAHFAVVQGAYQRYCIARQVEIMFSSFSESEHVAVAMNRDEPSAALASDLPADAWLRFQALVREWVTARGAMSSITEAAMIPAYQSIIGMGPAAVPFIFAQLRAEGDEPDQWFWALKAITGADPVHDDDRGDFPAMAKAWLAWGKSAGYVW